MIKVDKTHTQYRGTPATLLAEVTTLLRVLHHEEHILDEDDFDFMKKMVFKSEEDLKKETLESLSKDPDSFLDFLKKLAGEDEADN